mmetsp:Transcript_741/g.2068  ORF Transcript_741/g.2068 Transcript_741/m.2068 type:complete len:220 (-) Transcript_741:213-872(-)
MPQASSATFGTCSGVPWTLTVGRRCSFCPQRRRKVVPSWTASSTRLCSPHGMAALQLPNHTPIRASTCTLRWTRLHMTPPAPRRRLTRSVASSSRLTVRWGLVVASASASSPTRRDPRDPCDLRQSGSQTAPTALTYPLQARRRTRALNTQARPQGRPRNPASTNLTAAPESACPAASRIGAKRTAPHQMCYGVLPRACRAVGATTMAQVRGTASRGGV